MENPPGRRKFILGIQEKFLIFFLTLDFLIVGILVLTVDHYARSELEGQIRERLLLSAQRLSEEIDEEISRKFASLKDLTNDLTLYQLLSTLNRPGITSAETTQVSTEIQNILEMAMVPGRGAQPALLVASPDGRIVAGNELATGQVIQWNFKNTGWWYHMESGLFHAETFTRGNSAHFLLALPIMKNSKLQGVLIGDFDLSVVKQVSQNQSNFSTSLLSSSGAIFFGNLSFDLVTSIGMTDLRPGSVKILELTEHFHAVFATQNVPGLDWIIVLSVPKSTVFKPIWTLRTRMIQVGLATAVLLALLVLWRMRGLLNPISKLQKTMASVILQGNLEEKVDIRSKDEVGELARTFNQMIQSLKERNRQLIEYHQELEIQRSKSVQSAKMAALGEMAGGLAHEINTPLAVISLSAAQLRELVDEEKLSPEVLSRLSEKIEQTALRIARIVRGMRSFSRDGSRDPFTETPLGIMIEDTLALCQEKFKYNQVSLDVARVAPEVTVECRPTQIVQVLLNLLGNAFDAIHHLKERWVRVTVADLGEQVRITIMDSGPGIPAEVRDKLFRPFFTTKEVGKGTGLGLSISKGVIESHGGSLSIDSSQPNTCFVIVLPKKVRQPEEHQSGPRLAV